MKRKGLSEEYGVLLQDIKSPIRPAQCEAFRAV